MNSSKINFMTNDFIKRNIKGRNFVDKNITTIKKINYNINEKKTDSLNEINTNIHIKKLIFEKPPESISYDREKFKKFKAKKINYSFDKLSKITNLFIHRLHKNKNKTNDLDLPKLSYNENFSGNNSKSTISNDKKNSHISNLDYNHYFPFIKKIIGNKKPHKAKNFKNYNYLSFKKKKNPINVIKIDNKSGYKSIYFSFNLEKQKEPSAIEKYLNNFNNSDRALINMGKKNLRLEKPKYLRFMNFNFVKGFNRMRKKFIENYNKINESKTTIKNDQNVDTDHIINDKGIFINFSDQQNNK